MKDEGGGMRADVGIELGSRFRLHPSSFGLPPSSFRLPPSFFRLQPSHPPPHHATIFDEPDMLEERAVRDVGHDPLPLQLRCQRGQLVQHDASDALTAQPFGNDEVDHADRIRLELHGQNGGEVADQFSDQS